MKETRKKNEKKKWGINLLVLFYTFIPTNHAKKRFPEKNYVMKFEQKKKQIQKINQQLQYT